MPVARVEPSTHNPVCWADARQDSFLVGTAAESQCRATAQEMFKRMESAKQDTSQTPEHGDRTIQHVSLTAREVVDLPMPVTHRD